MQARKEFKASKSKLNYDDDGLSGIDDLKKRFSEFVEISLDNKQYDEEFEIPLSIAPNKYKAIIKQKTSVLPETANILIKGRYVGHIIKSHSNYSTTTNNQIYSI